MTTDLTHDEVTLAEEIAGYYQHIKETPINSNPEDIISEMNLCNVFLGRASELVGITEAISNRAKGRFADSYEPSDGKFNATLFNRLMDGATADVQKLERHTERLSAALNHRLESLRSILSFEKEQMRNTR